MPQASDEFDSPWKDTVQQYFRPFLELCFPEIAQWIDWGREPESLEQELRAVSPDSIVSAQRVDQLMRTWRADTGESQMVLLHIEVQSQKDDDLAARLFQYHYRLRDTHREPVVTLCVLADESPQFKPSQFAWELWGCDIRFRFPVCKLLEFDLEEIQRSGNLVALVVAAHRAAQASKRDEDLRYQLRWALVTSLYERGLTRNDVFQLYRLISWILKLEGPKRLEFTQALAQYEESKRMPFVTDIEEIGIEKGLEQGRIETNRTVITTILERRFGEVPADVRDRVNGCASLAMLEDLVLASLDCASLEGFRSHLPSAG